MDKILEFGGVAKANTYSKFFSEAFDTNGSPKKSDLEKCLNNPQANIEKIISLSKYYYHANGTIMRVVNLIRDFGCGEPILQYPKNKKKAREIIEDFNKRIDIEQVYKDILFEMALTGNCAGYNRDGERIDIYPLSVIEVSPLIQNNKNILFYKIEDSGSDFGLSETVIEKKNLPSAYPEEVRKGINSKSNVEKIPLDVEKTFFMKGNSSRYEAYGVTFLLPAFPELAHKNLLKQAENSTATGIIEQILMINVGDNDNKPKPEQIQYYSDLFEAKSGSIRVTVPHFVSAKWVTPDTSILGEDKFKQVDKDLLSALGVSLTLIRGEGGGSYADGLINVAGLIKTIDGLRSQIPKITEDWYKQELKKNGIDESYCPSVSLAPVEIDRTARHELVKWLFEHASLPYEILFEESGYDYDYIKVLKEEEKEENAEDIFKLREQPFQGKQGGATDEGGRPEKNLGERKTDKNKSNNENPRTKQKQTV